MLYGMKDAMFSQYFHNKSYMVEASPFFRLILVKFVCSMALHFTLYIHIHRGMNVTKFVVNHPERFKHVEIVYLCCFINVMVSIVSEILNVYMLAY